MGHSANRMTPWGSIGYALESLYPYLIAALAAAAVIAFLAVALGSIAPDEGEDGAPTLRIRFRRYFPQVTAYCFAFTLFGAVTAFFLAQGLSDDGNRITNPLLTSFVTPFIALLTGGVAFVAAKTRLMLFKNDIVLGVIGFLLTTVVCYQAMKQVEYGADYRATNALELPATSASQNNDLPPTPAPPQPGPGEENLQ